MLNNALISNSGKELVLSQPWHAVKITLLDPAFFTLDLYILERAKGA